ncbi:hypothetical protein BDA96_01G192600 [Sorghum bicolor]|uniref:Cystatin domain-containing protein n=2 Tax=Sorghum bicolor TaxID=4558 RepID=A0A921RZS4_SORBI|nr:putative cysteine proteinase inhibitor 7 [Sorghum bicolor]EER93890.1 hypothetical protein SORBI_3001G183500 [Sorghum bicolor]KAG0548734.1 hypothetical protein BDA96_01G192600 [Sorghum bicolor]|eukprot:XP_002466892.1 putative cysteine proteinase inhibitor 7 [Sorghum bicolor]
MRTSFLLLAAAICAVVASVVSADSQGWFPLPDIDAPKVQQLGRWAVTEHDKKANDKVKFNRVVSGEETLDPELVGIKYHLVIDASDGSGQHRKYEAVLGEEWIGRIILISFNPAR